MNGSSALLFLLRFDIHTQPTQGPQGSWWTWPQLEGCALGTIGAEIIPGLTGPNPSLEGEGTFPTGDPSSQPASFTDKELGISWEGTLYNFLDRSRECNLTPGPFQRRRAGGRRDELQPWQSSKPRFYGSHTAQSFGCFACCAVRYVFLSRLTGTRPNTSSLVLEEKNPGPLVSEWPIAIKPFLCLQGHD
jgi:hypothetical protein